MSDWAPCDRVNFDEFVKDVAKWFDRVTETGCPLLIEREVDSWVVMTKQMYDELLEPIMK